MGMILLKLLGWIVVVALVGIAVVIAICAVTLIVMTLDACGEALRKWRADRAKR